MPPTLVVDAPTSRYVTPDNTTLRMNVVPVSIDFGGADTSSIAIYGIGGFNPGVPTRLQVGRRYALFTSWAKALDREDSGLSTGYPVFAFGVDYNGNAIVVDAETAESLQPVPGSARARVVLSHVTINPNGYTGPLCIPSVGCVQGAPGALDSHGRPPIHDPWCGDSLGHRSGQLHHVALTSGCRREHRSHRVRRDARRCGMFGRSGRQRLLGRERLHPG